MPSKPLAAALLLLASCSRPEPAPAPPPAFSALPAPPAPGPSAIATASGAPPAVAPAPPPAAETTLASAPDADAWSDHTDVRRTPEAFCAQFLRDVRGAHAYGSPTPAPHCRVAPPPAAWRPGGPFLDARAMVKSYVHRVATQLLVKTAAGWRDTPIEWGVLEIEAATRPWETLEPDRFEIEGSRLLAYAAGSDFWWNEGTRPDGSTNPDDRFVRGAYGCELGPRALTCFYWDPTRVTPLGRKSAPSGFTAWSSLPWQDVRDLDFDARWPKRP
jgi:hypothetical protein